MATVNLLLTANDGPWIVGRLVRELFNRLPAHGFQTAVNSRGKFDIEYHGNVYFPPQNTGRVSVGLFAQEDHHTKHVPAFDGHVVLNPFMQEFVRERGAKDPVVIEQAVDSRFIRRPVFGVAGSVKRDGRKGEHLVVKMLEAGHDVVAWGAGWPCPIISDRFEDLPKFYEAIDYLLVASTMEGGCTPIIEAMAMGVPVIAPRIGFAIVRPVIEYEKGSWESLSGVLRYLTQHRTYDDWAADHAAYFQRFL